jgi:hypothetical protein
MKKITIRPIILNSAFPYKCFILLVFKFLIIILLLIIPGSFTSGQSLTGKTFIISPGGSDRNPGTVSQPFASLEAARDAARAAGPGNHRIIVMPGDYYLTKPFELDNRDNNLTIEADTGGKAILYGGILVTGWRRDGDKFWCADLPGVKEGTWDFRALVVNNRMPARARMPESGTLKYLNVFDVPWLTTVGGGFARKPTQEELTTLLYDPKNISESLDIRNAEVRIFHSWDESLVGVVKNDIKQHALIFSGPAVYPPGAFGKKDYVLYNTREGMTKPGQWYLDRTNGRLVYWPLESEDMTSAKIIAPKIDQIIRITGEQDKKTENITIRGLVLQVTSIPLKSAGFGGSEFDGALSILNIQKCRLEKLEITNAGGLGISATEMTNCRITDCHVHNTGACCIRINGVDLFIANNHIHDAGIYYPSAAALYVNGSSRLHIYRNEIHDAPYCGMIIGETVYSLIEENLISRVMLELHDGAAIYTSGVGNCILRGNVARDIKVVGIGHGARSYYLDEGSYDCIIENNVSIGVSEPVHNHIARNSIIRDNVFIADEDISLTFQRSSEMTFEGNTVITPGRVILVSPNAVTSWSRNRIFCGGRDNNNLPQAFTIDSAMPFVPVPARKTRPLEVMRSAKAPILDGQLLKDEWPGTFQPLDRESTRRLCSGAPVTAKFSYDNKFLYIGAMLTMFDIANISKGDKWGKDDGVEISIGGFDKGKPATFVIRAYFNGTVQSVTDAGVTVAAAERIGKNVRYVSKIMDKPGKGWIGELAIPLDVIGLKTKPDTKVAFNICAFINEYDKWHYWEGTQGESWEIDKGGVLKFTEK